MSVHSRFWHFHNSPVEAKERPTTAAEFVYLECGCCLERLDLHVWEKKKGCSVGNRVHYPTVICHKLWVFLSLLIHPGKRRMGGEEGGVRGWGVVISDAGGKFSSITRCFRTLSCTGPKSSSSPLPGFRTGEQKFHLHAHRKRG